jgi:co-chaperonin GroES (HSP10)
MTVKAVAFRVVVVPDEVEEVSKGGIVQVFDKKVERNAQTLGTIVDIGEDAFAAYRTKTQFAGLQVGDKVYYAKYAGKWVQDPKTKEEFLVLNDDDIAAKYEDEDVTPVLAS